MMALSHENDFRDSRLPCAITVTPVWCSLGHFPS